MYKDSHKVKGKKAMEYLVTFIFLHYKYTCIF